MAVATFDTLKYSKALREAGVSEKQADAQAVVLAEALSVNFRELTTKDDLKGLEERFDYKLKELEQRLTSKIDLLGTKTYGEAILVRWMLGLLITMVAGLVVRLVFFPLK